MAAESSVDQSVLNELEDWAQVIVVGGGPAGAVTALLLARGGIRVGLIHADRSNGLIVGESLPPSARPTLERLGLAQLLDDPAHLPSPGNVSMWGSQVARESDFLFSPYGNGLHLDRASFDGQLRTTAADAGARLAMGWWDSRDPAVARRSGAPHVLIDCTGRSASVARASGARHERLDRLVAVVGVIRGTVADADRDARTIVASVPEGWWYSARLPDGRRVAAFHTDANLLPDAIREDPAAWHSALLRVPLIGEMARDARAGPPAQLRVLAADTRRIVGLTEPGASDRPIGDAFSVLATGDAAMAFDPLSSQGILSAIQSAEEAVPEVLAALSGNRDATASAVAHRAEAADLRWSTYRRRLAATYGDERRWPDAPFWVRRHAT